MPTVRKQEKTPTLDQLYIYVYIDREKEKDYVYVNIISVYIHIQRIYEDAWPNLPMQLVPLREDSKCVLLESNRCLLAAFFRRIVRKFEIPLFQFYSDNEPQPVNGKAIRAQKNEELPMTNSRS